MIEKTTISPQKPKYSDWLVAGMYNGLQKLSIPLFGLISTMILAHGALSKNEMGIWSLFLVITSFIELIRQALVKTSLIKHLNHADESQQVYILSAALLINSIITLVLIFTLLIGAGSISAWLEAPMLQPMIYIFAGGMLLLIPFSHFEWLLYSKSDFKSLFWVYFVRQGTGLFLILFYLFFYHSLTPEILVIFFNVGILAGILVGYYFSRRYVTGVFALRKDWVQKLWNFGRFVFGTGISTLVFGSASQLLLSPILGSTSPTASQGVANRVVNFADIPSQVLSDILFPKSSKKENAENAAKIKYFYEKTVGATLSANIPAVIAMVFLPKYIILALGGSEYLEAVPYLQMVSITCIFLNFQKYFGIIIDSTGNPRLNFIVTTILAIFHVGNSYFFISKYGYLGAAYAILISHFVGFVVTQSILYKKFGISWISCFGYAIKFYPDLLHIAKEKLVKRK